MSLLIVFACILILILLITWGKVNAFIAFIIVSILAGILLGLPVDTVVRSVEKGMGDTLGSLVIVISLGAMLGKLVAESGAAQKIASVMMHIFGQKYLNWALMITGLIIGIPLFYNVGFVLVVPLIFSITYRYKLPAIATGVPMLAALSVTHGFLPPHPSPVALVQQLDANMGYTLIYGLVATVPSIIIAGPVFARSLKNISAHPLETFRPKEMEDKDLPGAANSIITSLLPVFLLIATTVLLNVFGDSSAAFKPFLVFISESSFVMLISVLVATYTLGLAMGTKMKHIMRVYADSIKDIGLILLIIAGAGALKEILTASGVSAEIADSLKNWSIHPLLLGWLIAAVIRVCVGSATVAGLTTAGIIAPLVVQSHVNPNLMVLAVGAGSLMFSHVNDSGFWLFKEYFNVSIKDTIRTWSLMETLVSIVGIVTIMLMSMFIQ